MWMFGKTVSKKDANTNKLNLLETLQIYEWVWNFRVIVTIRQWFCQWLFDINSSADKFIEKHLNVNIRRPAELILKLHTSHKLFSCSVYAENVREFSGRIIVRDHTFSTYTTFSEKLIFLTQISYSGFPENMYWKEFMLTMVLEGYLVSPNYF